MVAASTKSEAPATLGAFQREFRRDPGRHGAVLAVCCVLSLLALAGIGWMIVMPDATALRRAVTIAVLAAALVGAGVGVRHTWRMLAQRFRLHEHGLSYFDGRAAHHLHWTDVAEIRESVSTVKMYGITTDGPKLAVALVSDAGVRCSIGTDVLELEALSPVVVRAVNDCLREDALKRLQRGEAVSFGVVAVSDQGVALDAPPPRSRLQSIWDRMSYTFGPEIKPCRLGWEDIADIRVAARAHGDKLSRQVTFNQVEIRRRGRKTPVCRYPIPDFPNFTVFAEVLERLGHPLRSES